MLMAPGAARRFESARRRRTALRNPELRQRLSQKTRGSQHRKNSISYRWVAVKSFNGESKIKDIVLSFLLWC